MRTKGAAKFLADLNQEKIDKLTKDEVWGKSESGPKQYKQYRKLKSSGTAHEWQKLISQSKFDKIYFSKIHGRDLKLQQDGTYVDSVDSLSTSIIKLDTLLSTQIIE